VTLDEKGFVSTGSNTTARSRPAYQAYSQSRCAVRVGQTGRCGRREGAQVVAALHSFLAATGARAAFTAKIGGS